MSRSLFLALLAAPLVACSGSGGAAQQSSAAVSVTASGQPAQMNDLSILYPMPSTSSELSAYLAPTTKGVGGELLPESVFDAVTGEKPGEGSTDAGTRPGASPLLNYAALRAIAFRLDPCFANLGPVVDEASCQNQLRVVYQSITVSGGAGSAVDGAVHVFYSLTRAQFVAALNEIVAARLASDPSASDLGPLAVHPLVARQGMKGAMAKALNAVVRKYAGAGNIVRATQFLGTNLDTVWTFSGIDVAEGKGTAMQIASLPTPTTSEMFFLGFGPFFGGGTFQPTTTSSDDMQLLTSSTAATVATAAAQTAAFNAALRVQNPDFNSPNTIDCASCHTAESAQIIVGQGVLGLSAAGNSNAFTADPSWVPAADTKATTPAPTQAPLNLHAFSYSGGQAMINARVVNETAAIVAYVNDEVLPAETSGVSLDPVTGSGSADDAASSVPTPITPTAADDAGAAPDDSGPSVDDATPVDDGGAEAGT